MLTFLIGFLILLLVLFLVYWGIGHFGLPSPAQQIVGIICVLILLLYVLRHFGMLGGWN